MLEFECVGFLSTLWSKVDLKRPVLFVEKFEFSDVVNGRPFADLLKLQDIEFLQ
jgi:hypothetical protein